ncbi:Fe-S-containing hydro-lyase [Thermosediminibacter oceani]|uniref:Hydro-lyase, Fe-S type, tartrate/fumarate subfamily, beta subunit n=1 Tax=Thermosediminibacter oceani (strain ATCC BAA-1034 / DSM 16646 / JW/IW-1228P) TaxID=555079 RepID=D9RZ02_THEOJ|nr:Fe-S-containing hydro-lyase [Thermosediminibacter oceani]ADL08556.1 hydro-lyase, Fe-S type, tartrate/fumarate subfamily, beta subunit [Thermosediminibacter oceani DSM 16646]
MGDAIRINTPVTSEQLKILKAGDSVLISGVIYTARDAAHKRLVQLMKEGKDLPVNLNGQIIYYVGPAPAKPGYAAGPAGPTTSGRMDPYTVPLLERGLKGMIGKGIRSAEVIEAMKKYGAVYFGAVGGAAALISRSIKKVEVVAFEDLGTEAIHRFYVEDFPAIVIIDSEGNNLYEIEPPKYRR